VFHRVSILSVQTEYVKRMHLVIIGCVSETRALLTIEMVHVAEGTATINFVDLDPKERMELPFDTLYKGILELKQYGKDYVEREDFNAAKKE